MARRASAKNEASEKRSTIYDVARLAGVSAGTVSHVINRTAPISEETTKRVAEAMKALNYHRNENARALRTSDSKIVGIVIQDITSEYYAQSIASILDCAQKEGYAVFTANGQFNMNVLKNSVAALIERRVNGIIFVGGANDEAIYQLANAANVPIVFGDRFVPDFPCVEFNNYETVNHLVHALYRQGYRRFSYFGEGLSTQQNLDMRLNGFCDGVKSLGIPESDVDILLEIKREDIKMKTSFELFPRHLHRQSEDEKWVIVASNDMIAQGVISVALRAGWRVPEDVAVFGFDNISIASYATPSISTVVQDPYELGKCCFDLLKERMSNTDGAWANVMLEQEIAVRDSAWLDAGIAQSEGLRIYRD